MLPRRFFISPLYQRIVATRTFVGENSKFPGQWSIPKFKWEKNPVEINAPANCGTCKMGNPDDPEINPEKDIQARLFPEKGDKIYPAVVYREPGPIKWEFYVDRMLGKIFGGLFWFWVFYHLYWDYGRFTGHWYLPYLHEFTDEELGIPPDDAEDPTPDQYWGNHGKPFGTYR